MDILLFDRYGLRLNESDPAVIENALETKKNESNWVKNLNAKNDRILSRAKEEQARWTNDRNILLNDDLRKKESLEIFKGISNVVNYVDEHFSDENCFVNAEAVFVEMGLRADDIKYVFDKYKSAFSIRIDPQVLESRKIAARQIAKSYGEYSRLISSLNDGVKGKFYESGIDISTFFSALNLPSCRSAADIETNSERLSLLSYDIYDRKLLKDTEKNAFMDIFSKNSNHPSSLKKVLSSDAFSDFGINNWILLKYIPLTCRLMDSKTVNDSNLDIVPDDEKEAYVTALKKVFGIKADIRSAKSSSFSGANVAIPSEVRLGDSELLKGNFNKAEDYFRIAVKKDPYCWQGYWGMFKAKTNSRTDDETRFPGFMEKYKEFLSGKCSDPIIDLYIRAKENALAQKAKEIDFYRIEDRFTVCDLKNKQYEDYADNLSKMYDDINIGNINNSKFVDVLDNFEKKASKYKKDVDYVENSWMLTAILAILGAAILIFGLFSFNTNYIDLGRIGIAIAVIPGIITGIIVYFDEYSILFAVIGFVVAAGLIGALMFVSYKLIGVIGVFGSILLLVIAALLIYLIIRRLMKKSKLKKSLTSQRMEAYDILLKGVVSCCFEDLGIFYENENLASYRIEPMPTLNLHFQNYLDMLEIKQDQFLKEIQD